MDKILVQCQTPKSIPTYDYEAPVIAAEAQHDIFWLPTEPKVEKDLHSIKTEIAPAALHGIMTGLKLFTLYEQVAGNEYWGGRFKRMFPRPDFRRMAHAFSNVEINVHSPFYQRVDELLGLNTDEFYSSFTDDPVLKSRMDFLDNVISGEDDLLSVGVFSMVEGAILYSTFAFLMSFQANGNNYIANIHSGLTFSVKDENLHSEGGAWAFRTLLAEKIEAGLMSTEDVYHLHLDIRNAARKIYLHECAIIDKMFSEGPIKGILKEDLIQFVKSRINLCLDQLEVSHLFDLTNPNPVADWFYKMIGGDIQHDFFVKIGSSYNRNWSPTAFTWTQGGLLGRTWEEINESV
jgi:ribonucleotide reductase beta subunit family protein with ferritin-like domain